MQEEIFEFAYLRAKQRYDAALIEVYSDVQAQFPDTDFDSSHRASSRAVELHVRTLHIAKQIWAGSLPYDKAQASVAAQFPDFPRHVVENALAAAYAYTR